MSLFTPKRPDAFNRDDVVVHHEVAHTVVWCSHGRGIEHIRFKRIEPPSPVAGLLMGGSGNDSASASGSESGLEHMAERLLAGESAARRRIGSGRGEISTMSVELTESTNVPALVRVADTDDPVLRRAVFEYNRDSSNWFSQVQSHFNRLIPAVPLLITPETDVRALDKVARLEDDAVRAVIAGWMAVKKEWYSWVETRLANVVDLVDSHWSAIEGISNELIPKLPQQCGELLMQKDELESLLARHGVKVRATDAD